MDGEYHDGPEIVPAPNTDSSDEDACNERPDSANPATTSTFESARKWRSAA